MRVMFADASVLSERPGGASGVRCLGAAPLATCDRAPVTFDSERSLRKGVQSSMYADLQLHRHLEQARRVSRRHTASQSCCSGHGSHVQLSQPGIGKYWQVVALQSIATAEGRPRACARRELLPRTMCRAQGLGVCPACTGTHDPARTLERRSHTDSAPATPPLRHHFICSNSSSFWRRISASCAAMRACAASSDPRSCWIVAFFLSSTPCSFS